MLVLVLVVQQRLRPVLKAFTGVHQFHNYNCRAPAGAPAPPHPEEGGGMGASCPPQSLAPTAPAPEDESMNWRRMFRSYCVGTVRLHEEVGKGGGGLRRKQRISGEEQGSPYIYE